MNWKLIISVVCSAAILLIIVFFSMLIIDVQRSSAGKDIIIYKYYTTISVRVLSLIMFMVVLLTIALLLNFVSKKRGWQKIKFSNLAIAGFIFGFAIVLNSFLQKYTENPYSDFTFLFLFIVLLTGIICSVLGLVNIKKSKGSLKGKGFAIIGLVLSLIVLPEFLSMMLKYLIWSGIIMKIPFLKR